MSGDKDKCRCFLDILRLRLSSDRQIAEAAAFFCKKTGQYQIHGLSGESKALILALGLNERRASLIIAHDDDEQRFLLTEIRKLLPARQVLALPVDEGGLVMARAHSREGSLARMKALDLLLSEEGGIVVASVQSAAQRLPDPDRHKKNAVRIECGKEYELSELIKKLSAAGYERCEEIEGYGQFAVRGGILDVFPANAVFPARIEFFGDEIDSIREFSIQDQRSKTKLDKVDIMSFRLDGTEAAVSDYLPADAVVIIDEPLRARDTLKKLLSESPERKAEYSSYDDMLRAFAEFVFIQISSLPGHVAGITPEHVVGIRSRQLPPYRCRFDVFVDDAAEYIERGYSVFVLVSDKSQAVEIAKHADNRGVTVAQFFDFAPGEQQIVKSRIYIVRGEISAGIEMTGAKTVLISESDLFISRKNVVQQKISEKKRNVFLDEIKTGDYIVHSVHGIGRYAGVETLVVDGMHRDYFHVQYAGTDKLFVPVEQVNLLQRYIGGEEALPRLSRLGNGEWEKRKSRAKKAVEDIAQDLIVLHARREADKGIAFLPDCDLQKEFEADFPYAETPDQLRSLAEIKADMEASKPMERLLCGDVGFGKTELAMRAAFKAVMSGYQVAILAPTTVLALQHYNNFYMRCHPFGVKTGLNCRLVRDENKRLAMNAAREGKLDILVGTHGLLREDTQFKKLGLIVVDEEQRFGVKQKEFMKKWRGNADILSLSATPIPRTLHMALGGVRDMSVIETPPAERLPVQTYVVEATDEVVRQAVRKELNRGGQVFFVYNRVATMEKVFLRLKDLVPDARVAMAHGQMPEEAMELAITEFYERRYDILLATTIVENGIDMPNVNTVIVYDADRLGLSQLHQLRGRVGRSSRQAYAYFLYRENKAVNETAERRLRAIQDYTELGVGFKIAMRDLEIRGAGDILGSRQHGHITGIGFLLYSKMLEEAIMKLRGGKIPEILLEPHISLKAEGYIPDSYIKDSMHKIGLYQRIAAAHDEEETADILEEMIDRFGEPPKPVLALLDVAVLKSHARRMGIAEVMFSNNQLQMTMTSKPEIDPDKIIKFQRDTKYRVELKLQKPEKIIIGFRRKPASEIEAALEITGKLL